MRAHRELLELCLAVHVTSIAARALEKVKRQAGRASQHEWHPLYATRESGTGVAGRIGEVAIRGRTSRTAKDSVTQQQYC